MAGKFKLKLDRKAIGKIAKGAEAQAVVTGVANQIASAAGSGAEVREYTTDRAVASAGVPADDQAADGRLSRAAAAAGISISQR